MLALSPKSRAPTSVFRLHHRQTAPHGHFHTFNGCKCLGLFQLPTVFSETPNPTPNVSGRQNYLKRFSLRLSLVLDFMGCSLKRSSMASNIWSSPRSQPRCKLHLRRADSFSVPSSQATLRRHSVGSAIRSSCASPLRVPILPSIRRRRD